MARVLISNVRAAEDFLRRNIEEVRACLCPFCKKLLDLSDNHDGVWNKHTFIVQADAAARKHGWR